MSKKGVFAVARSIFDNPVFANEPFTEREAFMWLISDAAWRPHRRRVGVHLVSLERAQVVSSMRYMAERWGWDKMKVARYLKKLKSETMIDTPPSKGISIITICNYNKYQRVGLPQDLDSETETDTPVIQERDASETGPIQKRSIQSLEHSNIEGEDLSPSLFGTALTVLPAAVPKVAMVKVDVAGMFDAWYAIYPKKLDRKDALKSFTKVINGKEATFEELVAGVRQYAADMAGTEKRFIKAPAVWLNKGSWSNESSGAGAPPARSGRVGSALQGIASRMTESDFHDLDD